jgi:peptidyl-prolyl cis-trans isomerase SurA
MKINKLILGVVLAINSISFAQSDKKEVLFTIDNNSYYTDEFIRVYNKNIDLVKDDSQKDLNQYLDLFIGYKLKINKANKIGLQNNQKYIDELKSYRTQLSKNYTSDTKVTKALIDEGYERSQKEIRVSHILITCEENVEPADTLKAYNQAMDIRKKALVGESFEELAVKFSQDPSAKDNKGDLGYFSAFRMVYPFENAAYKTKVGEISMPTRTRFGYHLVKVVDSRPNRGEVSVAHIMILKKPNSTPEDIQKGKSTIQDIYTKLKQGEKFESLATQFSEDKSSSVKGGLLPNFSSGQLSSKEFEDVAFGLKEPQSYSEPFETQYGWHIAKLVEKFPIKSLKEMERDLDTKIRRDDRSRLLTNSLVEKVRKRYRFTRNDIVYKKVQNLVNDKYYKGEWTVSEEQLKDFKQTLLTIENKNIEAADFISQLESQQRSNLKVKPLTKLVDNVYESFLNEQLTTYYNDNLEKEFPDFANVIEEYRDGLLLFDLMEKEIWDKAKQDSIGLKKYFDINKAKYQWKNRAEVVIASSTKKDIAKQAQKMLKKDAKIEAIKESLNTKDVVNVMIKEETVEEGAENTSKKIAMKTGVSGVYQEGEFYFVNKVNKILPAGQKTLEETKGRVINDYQQYLEENWVTELKKEFKVTVNQDVFERVKSANAKK